MKRLALLTLTALLAATISACGEAGEKKVESGAATEVHQQGTDNAPVETTPAP